MPTLTDINQMDRSAFVETLGPVFEHSPWIAEQAWEFRPFAGPAQLHAGLCRILDQAPPGAKLALIKAHPDLGERMEKLTQESTREQAAAGLDSLSPDELSRFQKQNSAYREKFGFPFVICARLNDKNSIFDAFSARLENAKEQEILAALEEIEKIARLRLNSIITES